MINQAFAELMVRTFNDPADNGVHLLFNQWWAHAPEEVKAQYVDGFLADPEFKAFVDEGYYAEPLDMDALAACPEGSLGRTYWHWIVDNGLTAQIATNYRDFHEMLDKAGMLAGMPEQMKYAVLRGFQLHDFLHVLTGYDSSGTGEIALQAFCLAQLNFPYFAMWMSVITARMTFVDPSMITPIMDAISDGWTNGRSTPNLQTGRWEDMVAEPLEDIRARFSITGRPLVRTPVAA